MLFVRLAVFNVGPAVGPGSDLPGKAVVVSDGDRPGRRTIEKEQPALIRIDDEFLVRGVGRPTRQVAGLGQRPRHGIPRRFFHDDGVGQQGVLAAQFDERAFEQVLIDHRRAGGQEVGAVGQRLQRLAQAVLAGEKKAAQGPQFVGRSRGQAIVD